MKALAGEPTPLEAVHVYTPASSWDDHDDNDDNDVHGNDDGDNDDVCGNDDGDDDDVHGNDDGDDDEDNDRTNTLPMEGTTSSRVCKVVSPLGKKPSWKDVFAQDEIPKNISHQNWARSCPEKTFVAQDKKPYWN